ncbi:MAG: XdhC family protein [Ignavibacteria bacterium]|jgi:xanthine dehydrogenase accessory factor
MKNLKFWKTVAEKIESDVPTILWITADASKSSPGKPGFKLAVTKDFDIFGTCGGGALETKIIEESKKILYSELPSPNIRVFHHDKLKSHEQSGLICGGKQVLLQLSLTSDNLETIKKIITAIEEQNFTSYEVSVKGINYLGIEIPDKKLCFEFENGNNWRFKEVCGIFDTLYIFGGGHVSLALSQIMSLLEFNIVVFESRPKISTLKNNVYAKIIIIENSDEIEQHIEEGDSSYVAIMSHDLTFDKEALCIVLKKNVRYIGMIGSKKKIRSVYKELEKEGVHKEVLKKVCAPIGLKINDITAEEIAVSIAGQIIAHKNN